MAGPIASRNWTSANVSLLKLIFKIKQITNNGTSANVPLGKPLV